jgi:hypothetical protein
MAVGSKLAGIATGILARKVADKVLKKVWERTRHTEPPADPASPHTTWATALSWALASGAAYGVSRIATTKGVATARTKLTGKTPEGMEGPGGKRKG